MTVTWRRYPLTLLCLNTAALLCSGCNSAEFTCDPLDVPPTIDWEGIEERARIVLDVTCTARSNDELVTKYETDATHAIVRELPNGARYMLLVGRSPMEQELFLPGTQFTNPDEIITDLDQVAVFDTELGASFHRGFLNAATQIRYDVAPLLQYGFVTRLTGYSLGGATAAILALQLQKDQFPVETILTFGQPKVTDELGASKFSDQPILRIKAGLDGITHLFAPEYRHYGDEIILLDGNRIVYLNQNDRNYDASTDPDLLGLSFSDHTTYLSRVLSKLEGTTQVSFCKSEQFITPAEHSQCE